MSFDRLIRFVSDDGKTLYGNLEEELPTRDIPGRKVEILNGDLESGFSKSGEYAVVEKILCPLPSTPIIICIGLNYHAHAKETNLQVPTYPTVFTKPPDALAGPLDPIVIPKDCQSQLDYEGELTFIFSKDAKNIAAADAHEYILGYTAGNDVSARNFQIPASVSGGQFGYAKSFDGFAPIGAVIASPALIKDAGKLRYKTLVNGNVRQQTGTDDMIWSVPQIVEHLTRGTTVRRGTVVMTGTPSGVALGMGGRGWLGDGDEVVVEIQGVGGGVGNRMVFEK